MRTLKKLFLLSGFLILANIGLQAQQKLSLLDCVEIAIENNLNLAQTEVTRQQNAANLEQSKLEWLPNLNASINGGNQWGLSVDPTTDNVSTQSFQSGSGGIGSSATLFNGGRIKANVKLQELLLSRSNSDIKSQKDNIAIEVAARFVDVLLRKDQIRISENQRDTRKVELERTLKLIKSGAAAASTKYDLEAQLANSEFSVIQAENALDASLLLLKQSMNVPFEEEIDILIPELPVPDAGDILALSPAIVYPEALLTQGIIKSAEKSEEISNLNIKLAEVDKYPSISLNGNLGASASSLAVQLAGTQVQQNVPVAGLLTQDGVPIIQQQVIIPELEDKPLIDQIQDNFAQSIGVSINIPIFNNGRTKNQIKQAQLNLDNSRINTLIQKRNLEQQIQTAYLDADLALKQYEAAKIQLTSLEKAQEIAKKRYDLGAGSIYDYFTAQNNLIGSQVQLSRAKYDLIYKVKILEFYKDNNFTF